jgi:transcriptional regulator with XRE-family HTH domain
MNAHQRRKLLTAFLRERRARLRPEDVGLPRSGRRRVPGLRREEVAELAGVSLKWYAVFEAGTSERNFSVEFVRRVAAALRLDPGERAILYEFAFPEIAEVTERVERSRVDGALRATLAVGRFARKACAASSFDEAAALAAKTLLEIARPDCVSAACMRDASGRTSGVGIGGRERYWTPVHNALCVEVHVPLSRGGIGLGEYIPLVEEVAREPSVILPFAQRRPDETSYDFECELERWRAFNGRLRTRSVLATPLYDGTTFRGILGASWLEPRSFHPAEVDLLETLGAIVELAGREALT